MISECAKLLWDTYDRHHKYHLVLSIHYDNYTRPISEIEYLYVPFSRISFPSKWKEKYIQNFVCSALEHYTKNLQRYTPPASNHKIWIIWWMVKCTRIQVFKDHGQSSHNAFCLDYNIYGNLKGHWTTSASFQFFFKKSWDFCFIRSVYLCNDCMPNLTCNFNSVTKIYAFFFQ